MIQSLWIKLTSKYIGEDSFKNKYYESKWKKDYLGIKKRYIVYNEISFITPMWHSWLHHMTNKIPRETEENYNIVNTESLEFNLYTAPENDHHKHRILIHDLPSRSDTIMWKPKT